MPARDLDAVFYAAEAPTIEYRDGMFHIGYGIRTCYFEFVMAPSVYFRALHRAVEVSRKHRKSNVVPFHAAASGSSGK